jgi:hypothetical protein
MTPSGFKVSEEHRPGQFRSFYWAAELSEAEQHAECIRALFPDRNIVVTPSE